MPPKRKRKSPPPDQQSHNAVRASSKSAAPSLDHPGKKRRLEAMPVSGSSPKPNLKGTQGLEPPNTAEGTHQPVETTSASPKSSSPKPSSGPAKRKRPKIVKLDPVAFLGNSLRGSNPTGPWSQRGEGKNKIAITRRLELGAYLRRCVELVKVDGYRKIYLSALGPAVAHALLLGTSLPVALAPTFASSDIKTTIMTGTVQCIDEVIPDEEDEDEDEGGMQVRQKSCVNIDIIIGDGERVEGITVGKGSKVARNKGQTASKEKGK